jgi:hypothetical protein
MTDAYRVRFLTNLAFFSRPITVAFEYKDTIAKPSVFILAYPSIKTILHFS